MLLHRCRAGPEIKLGDVPASPLRTTEDALSQSFIRQNELLMRAFRGKEDFMAEEGRH